MGLMERWGNSSLCYTKKRDGKNKRKGEIERQKDENGGERARWPKTF